MKIALDAMGGDFGPPNLVSGAVMALQAGLFYAEGYLFLAILGPRLVHDVTAFTFYIVHDMNRHGADPRNHLYRLASKLGLGVFWVVGQCCLGFTQGFV